MAITDIQISEELETNAPSIKYSGNEGPKSPQEMEQMIMASLEEEYAKYVFEMQEQGLEPMSLRQFMDQAMAEGQMSKGPILPSPEDPVNPFAPKPTGPVLPDRQMAAYGGIMGMDGRRQYGIGSSLKKFVRKVIPNEVSEIAVKAAPFVAPFNAPLAAAMSGLGSFDQTGRIGSSLKRGLGTFAQGKIMSGIGGGGYQSGKTLNPFSGDFYTQFSSPIGTQSGLGKMFAEKLSTSGGSMAEGVGGRKFTGDELMIGDPRKALPDTVPGNILKTIKDYALDSKLLTGLAVGTLGGTALMGNMEADEIQDLQRGEGLDVQGIRAEVIEAYKDSSGEKLKALASKYPFLVKRESIDVDRLAMGGRIGKAEGGLMDLGGMEKDYRAEGGFVPIGKAEKADDVPARLSVNEFVFTADAVRNAGGGDIDKGAEVMENMMKNLEAGGQVSEESQGIQSLRAGGRAGFANGLTVDTDKVIEDIKKFSIPGLIGKGVKAGAGRISDVDLESIIKVIAKVTPSGMVMEKVTEFLVDRYGMSPDEAQMRIVNKLGTDANQGFKEPSGTSDEGYKMVGIESSAEDTSDIPMKNRLKNLLSEVPSIKMPRFTPETKFPDMDRGFTRPKPPLSPDATDLNPHQDINPLQTMEFRDINGNGIEDRAEGIYRDRDLIPYDPDRKLKNYKNRFKNLKEMFKTSERINEVI
jgi:hypothetical protein